MLGLLKARATFNKDKKDFRKTKSKTSCSISSWIYNCARSEIQKAKNSELGIKISPETARKKQPKVIAYNDSYDKSTDETAYTILADKEDSLERIRLYNELWLHLNKKFSSRDRNIVLDYFIHEKSVRWIDAKYGCSCYKVIAQVKEYLQSIYCKSSSSSTDMSVESVA
jgi:DNA-directed RNA polymerase specialized sigma subunit